MSLDLALKQTSTSLPAATTASALRPTALRFRRIQMGDVGDPALALGAARDVFEGRHSLSSNATIYLVGLHIAGIFLWSAQ